MNFKPVIYGLVDPLDSKHIRYIGSAINRDRPKRHKREAIHANYSTHKLNWIRTLLLEGREYVVVILEEFPVGIDKEILYAAEKFHIAQKYIEGHKLTNMTEGGDGVYERTLKWRIKNGEISKDRWANPENCLKISDAIRKSKISYQEQILNIIDRLRRHRKLLDGRKGSEQVIRSQIMIVRLNQRLAELKCNVIPIVSHAIGWKSQPSN